MILAADAPDLSSGSDPGASDRAHRVADAVAGWQRALADVGGRNTLLWYQDLPLGSLDLTTAHPGGVSKLLAGRPTTISDLVREPAALAEARERARAISAACTTALQRRGLTIGFLALGMATWAVAGGRVPHAPVLLRPITLRPTGPAALDFVLDLGAEVELNPVLAHYLRSEAGLEVDVDGLTARADRPGGVDPYPVYAELSRICSGVPEFSVAPRLIISTFPHHKLDMVADLSVGSDRLVGHDVVAALAGDADARARLRAATPDPPLDPDRDPASERLVLDADSGQGDVIDAVRRGANLAVMAAPGTGSTQTVANLVAALAAEGRSILLVSSERRSLTDVVARLGEVGLADLVLDATAAGVDRRTTLQQVVESFQSVVDRKDAPVNDEAPLGTSRLTDHRDSLRDHVAALHEVREPWGVSVHEAQWAIAELSGRRPAPASRVRLQGTALEALGRTRLAELARDLTATAKAGAWSADDEEDPWFGAHVLTDEDAEHGRELVTRLCDGGLDAAAATLDTILEESSLPPAHTLLDWQRALTTMAGVRETLEVFRPEVFDNPLDEHVAATTTGADRHGSGVELGAWARSRVRGQARRLLRPGRPPTDLHAELVAARAHRRAWHELVGAGGRPEISPRLDEGVRVHASLRADLDWLEARLASSVGVAGCATLAGLPLAELRQRLAALASRPERLAILPLVTPVLEELRAGGMGAVVDDLARRSVPAAEVT
ncbi:MAG: DNA helicase, partial [Lapillicoccus sp.]